MAIRIKRDGVTISGVGNSPGSVLMENDIISEDVVDEGFVNLLNDGDERALELAEIVSDDELPEDTVVIAESTEKTAGDTGEAPGPLEDPGAYTVAAVVDAMDEASPEEAAETQEREAAGKGRAGIAEYVHPKAEQADGDEG